MSNEKSLQKKLIVSPRVAEWRKGKNSFCLLREKENTQLKQQHKRCLNRQGCLKLVPQDKGFTTKRRLSSAAKCLRGSQRHLRPALTLRHTLNKCSYCYPWVLKPCHDSECFSLQLDRTSRLDTAKHTHSEITWPQSSKPQLLKKDVSKVNRSCDGTQGSGLKEINDLFKYRLALRRLTLYRHVALSLADVSKIFTLVSVLALLIYLVCVLFCSVLSTLSLIPWRQGLSQNPNPGNPPVSAVHNSVTEVHSHTL